MTAMRTRVLIASAAIGLTAAATVAPLTADASSTTGWQPLQSSDTTTACGFEVQQDLSGTQKTVEQDSQPTYTRTSIAKVTFTNLTTGKKVSWPLSWKSQNSASMEVTVNTDTGKFISSAPEGLSLVRGAQTWDNTYHELDTDEGYEYVFTVAPAIGQVTDVCALLD
jgi:hypothetical protein